jgi:hypothetical protein
VRGIRRCFRRVPAAPSARRRSGGAALPLRPPRRDPRAGVERRRRIPRRGGRPSPRPRPRDGAARGDVRRGAVHAPRRRGGGARHARGRRARPRWPRRRRRPRPRPPRHARRRPPRRAPLDRRSRVLGTARRPLPPRPAGGRPAPGFSTPRLPPIVLLASFGWLSARERAARESERMAAFTAGVGHELKTPSRPRCSISNSPGTTCGMAAPPPPTEPRRGGARGARLAASSNQVALRRIFDPADRLAPEPLDLPSNATWSCAPMATSVRSARRHAGGSLRARPATAGRSSPSSGTCCRTPALRCATAPGGARAPGVGAVTCLLRPRAGRRPADREHIRTVRAGRGPPDSRSSAWARAVAPSPGAASTPMRVKGALPAHLAAAGEVDPHDRFKTAPHPRRGRRVARRRPVEALKLEGGASSAPSPPPIAPSRRPRRPARSRDPRPVLPDGSGLDFLKRARARRRTCLLILSRSPRTRPRGRA